MANEKDKNYSTEKTEDQQAFLSQFNSTNDEKGLKRQSYDQAFDFINMSPEEYKLSAWGIASHLNKGVDYREYQMYLKEVEQLQEGNYEYFPDLDEEFSEDSFQYPQMPEELFPLLENKGKTLRRDGRVPTDAEVIGDWLGPVYAAAMSGELENLAEATSPVLEEIVDNGTHNLDKQIKGAEEVAAVQELETMVASGETDGDILSNAIKTVQGIRVKEDKFLAEKKFVEAIDSFLDRNPDWREIKLVNPGLVEKVVRENKNDAIIQSWLEDRKDRNESVNVVFRTLDWAWEVLNMAFGSGVVSDLRAFGTDPSTLSYIGQEIREMDPEDVPAALDALEAVFAKKSSYIGEDQGQVDRYFEGTFGDRADHASLMADLYLESLLMTPWGPLGKGATKTIIKMGGGKSITKDAVHGLENVAGTIYHDSNKVLDDVIGGAPAQKGVPTLGEAVDREILLQQKALDELLTTPGVERLSPEELTKAVEERVKELQSLTPNNGVSAANLRTDQETGVTVLDIFITKKDGVGYATESTARGIMTRRGLEGEVVEYANGFAIKQTYAVGEAMADNGLKGRVPTVGLFRRIMQSPKAFVDNLIGRLGTHASYVSARHAELTEKVWRNAFNKLNKEEINELGDIFNDMVKKGMEEWHTPSQLQVEARMRFGKELSENQMHAYYTYKQLNDFSHTLDNLAIYKEQAAKGLNKIELSFVSEGPFVGKVYKDSESLKGVGGSPRVYNAANNTAGTMTKEEIAKKIEEGYILIRPENASWTHEQFGEGVSFILTKSTKSVKVNPLDKNPLTYLGGPRIEYKAPFFIGQQVSGTFKDGTRYLAKPTTYRTAKTHKEAQKWVEDANEFLDLKKKLDGGEVSLAEAEEIMLGRSGKTYSAWEKEAAEEGWNLDHKFKYRRDREDFPMSVEDEMSQAKVRAYDTHEVTSGFNYGKDGRLSRRTDRRLKDVSGDATEVYDYLGTINRNINRAVNAGVYTDFKIAAINRFNTTYRGFMNEMNTMSPHELATKGTIRDGVSDEIKGQILAHQQYIRQTLRMRGEWDETVQGFMDRLATWVETGTGGARDKISTSIHLNRGNPMETVRAINFDLNLGMLNPRQYLTQLNSAVVSIAISPKHGLAAAKDLIPMRYALIADDLATSQYINGAVRHLTDGSDIARGAEQFKRIGFNSFGGNLAMMDSQSSLGATSNRLISKGRRAVQNARFAFEEGERQSRLVAYGIARRKYAEQFPKKDPYGRQADNWIREEADRILLSPNADNNALIHKGIGAIPTQFWSYMMKLSDAMFTGSGGRYTAAERGRIAAAQIGFYGAAGAPFFGYILDSYEKSTGQPLDPVLAKALHNGLVDTIPFIISGGSLDTNFAGANGIGGFWEQMLRDMTESPLPQILGGATGRNLSSGWRVMSQTAKMYSLVEDPSLEAITMTGLAGITSLVKGFSAYTQALVAYNTGIWYDKYGRAVAEVTKGEALASLMSFYPQAEKDAWNIYSNLASNRKKYIDDVVPAYEQLMVKFFNAETPEEEEHILGLINTMSALTMKTGYHKEVSSEVLRRLGQSGTMLEAGRSRLMLEAMKNKEGVNSNSLSEEQKEQLKMWYVE